jgi:ribosomal protein S18 acetylase RimI-like enzyme
LPLKQRLQIGLAVYAAAGLPALVRITPFTQPASLDDWLADQGWTRRWTTPASWSARPCRESRRHRCPPARSGERLDGAAYAQAVGQLRGTPPGQSKRTPQRLAASPVPYQGFAIRRSSDGAVLACGQLAREAELVGLYDIHTQAGTRRQGFAITLCERLLALSTHEGATIAYLQVEAGNEPARRLYHRLGFADAYAYHYRQAP